MACNECGEKPANTAKDFTKAVIEINNPERIVLIRRVSLPASMGTEDDTPVEIGKYFNVLLVYEANGHAYLYSSDGIPTLLTPDATDTSELERQLQALRLALADETTARELADTGLSSSVNSLSSSLSAETTARETEDANLLARLQTAVVQDVSAGADASTVTLTKTFRNLATAVITQGTLTLPMASSTQAGTISASDYASIAGAQGQITDLASSVATNTSNISDLQNRVATIEAGTSGRIETVTITTANWSAPSGASPFTASAIKTIATNLDNNSMVELVNDQAVLFANYGFSIGNITGQAVTFYSIGTPASDVTLTLYIKEVA